MGTLYLFTETEKMIQTMYITAIIWYKSIQYITIF